MEATHTITTPIGLQQPREVGLLRSAARTLRRLQVAIVNGSDHPCWTSRPGDLVPRDPE